VRRAGEVRRRVALVGKGLTFDSGGYNLKVGGMIEMMKFDCGGAAAVLGAAEALAGIRLPGVEARARRRRGVTGGYVCTAGWKAADPWRAACLHCRLLDSSPSRRCAELHESEA